MNMKKTMAAIAAGAVAVSAMATTVSAEDTNLWPTRTLSFNLVKETKETEGYKVMLTATLEHVNLAALTGPLTIEVTGLGNTDGLSNKDVVTLKGNYTDDNKPIRDMYFTKNNESVYYSPAGAAAMESATTDGATGKVVVPIAANVNAGDTAYALNAASTDAYIYITIEKYLEGNSPIKEIKDMRNALANGSFHVVIKDATDPTAAAWDSLPTGTLAGTKALAVTADGFEKVEKTTNEAYATGIYNNADALDHVYVASKAADDVVLSNGNPAKVTKKVSHDIVNSAINDGLVNFGNAIFTFKTWTGKDGDKSFNKNWWEVQQDDITGLFTDSTNYWINNWEDMTLFSSALIVNSNITMSLSGTSALKWTKDALVFDWDDIQANALNPNYYTNYIQSMVLRTGREWYWETLEIQFLENTAEDVTAGAGDEANDNVIDEDPDDGIGLDDEDDGYDDDEDDGDEDDGDEDDGDEDDGDEDNGDVDNAGDVSSPKTGNPAVALAVIPVALAAAAVVAKKRG